MKHYSFTKSYNKVPFKKNILVVDDDKSIRFILRTLLEKNKYSVATTGNQVGLLRLIKEISPDLLITDVKLPDGNILDSLSQIKYFNPELPVIVISGFSTLSTAVNSIKSGAFEYLSKPFDLEKVLQIVRAALDLPKSINKNNHKNKDIGIVKSNFDLIGGSQPMQDIFSSISKLIGNNLTVLITGEAGTGKKLVAKTIHNLTNNNINFFIINLANPNFNLIEKKLSEVLLKNSTFYLESIDEMGLESQLKLLDFLRLFYDKKDNNFNNIRLIISSKNNISKLIQKGLFREDLYYYLNIIPIFIPPLKDRKEDIKELVLNFLESNNYKKLPLKEYEESSFNELKNYNWPGNIKELENFIKRISILYPESMITDESIKNELNKSKALNRNNYKEFSEVLDIEFDKFFTQNNLSYYSSDLYNFFINKFEKSLIKRSLILVNGNQIKASELLGINRNTLRKKIKELEIKIIKRVKNWIFLKMVISFFIKH